MRFDASLKRTGAPLGAAATLVACALCAFPVHAQYGHDLDTGNFIAYSNLFARNGTRGESRLDEKGDWQRSAALRSAAHPQRSPGSGLSIHVHGDHSTATSRWTFFVRSQDNKLVPALSGYYDDELVRENGK